MNCALAIIMPNFSYGHDASCPYIIKMILQKINSQRIQLGGNIK
jgi:hypothetical protein